MGIIKTLRQIVHYPITAIIPEVYNKLVAAALELTGHTDHSAPVAKIGLLNCYCDLTRKTITEDVIYGDEIIEIILEFSGALEGDDFYEQSTEKKSQTLKILLKIINHVRLSRNKSPLQCLPQKSRPSLLYLWLKAKATISDEKKRFWCSWPLKCRGDNTRYLNIPGIWITHGEKFATQIYQTIKLRCEKDRTFKISHDVKLINFISNNAAEWPIEAFKDPLKIYNLFATMIRLEFKNAKLTDRNLPAKRKAWNLFVTSIEKEFIESEFWAEPIRPLPRAGAPKISPANSHIRTTEDGIEVKVKLLTDIPLHISSKETIEKILIKIEHDIALVRDWASHQADLQMQAFNRRREFATKGIPIESAPSITKEICTLANICATFENAPYETSLTFLSRKHNQLTGLTWSANELASHIGIPTTQNLFPHQCLLILEHPWMTPGFLINFDLYDKQGRLTGFFEESGRYSVILKTKSTHVSGVKYRKGAKRARQKYEISENAAAIIRNVIALTTPARDYLKSINDRNWRRLFIGSISSSRKPTKCSYPSWTPCSREGTLEPIIKQFSKHTNRTYIEIKKFIFNLNPSTVRASRAIEIYIKTGDSSKTAEALGHERENTLLLQHYIPEAIVAFIESQGARVLAKVIIYHSLKNSAHLLKAINFESMDMVYEFLSNREFPDIPDYLSDPEGATEINLSDQVSELIVTIGVGVLTVLLSLKVAVQQADPNRAISVNAKHWARVGELIETEILNSHDPLIQRHLKEALVGVDPSQLKGSIYEE
jgi:hypothetical protein